ncbi:MAG: AI-2E family transporter [Pseudomonadota bacterium]
MAPIAVILTGAVFWVGRDVLVPLIVGLLLAGLISAAARGMARLPALRRLPEGVRMVLAALVGIAVVSLTIGELILSLRAVATQIPDYASTMTEALSELAVRLGISLPVSSTGLVSGLVDWLDPESFVRPAASAVVGATGFLMLVLLYALFVLLERGAFESRLQSATTDRRAFTEIRDLATRIMVSGEQYVGQKTFVNVVLGVASAAVLWVGGIEHVLLWSVLIGVLNYIPYIGSVFAVVFPVAYGLGQTGSWETTLFVGGGLIAAQLVTGSLMEPKLFSQGSNLSTTVVLVSLAAWAALWGLWGAILAVPLTSAGVMILAQTEWGRPWAILVSRTGHIEPSSRMRSDPTGDAS